MAQTLERHLVVDESSAAKDHEFARVAIDQSAASGYSLLGRTAAKNTYLHAMLVIADADGAIKIVSANDAIGTGAVALTGTMLFKAGGGFALQFVVDPRACVRTGAVGKYLLIHTTAKFNGFAVVSSGA